MQDPADFTLRIVVMPPESALVDEGAPTNLFPRQAPVDLARVRVMRTMVPRDSLAPAPTPPPLPPPRHAWIPSTRPLDAARLTPPPPPLRPHASPLSDDDGKRAARRARAHRKIAWAQSMLRRFQFLGGEAT